MMRLRIGVLIVAVCLAVGCGGDDGGPTNPGGNNNSSGSMSATIDGAGWSASANSVQVAGGTTATAQGMLTVVGTNISTGRSVSLSLSYISGPGTYPLGVNIGTTAGGMGNVTYPPASWVTPLDGAAGTVTITARTSTRIAGTFQFHAAPPAGGDGVVVTAGEFDITPSAGLPPLPTGTPSVMSANLNGSAWNGATIIGLTGGQAFGGTTTDFSVSFAPRTTISAGTTYRVGSQMGLTIVRMGTTDSWAVTVEDSVGYVTLTTVNSERVSGTFAGTLPAMGSASSPMVITNGVFSVHMQ